MELAPRLGILSQVEAHFQGVLAFLERHALGGVLPSAGEPESGLAVMIGQDLHADHYGMGFFVRKDVGMKNTALGKRTDFHAAQDAIPVGLGCVRPGMGASDFCWHRSAAIVHADTYLVASCLESFQLINVGSMEMILGADAVAINP